LEFGQPHLEVREPRIALSESEKVRQLFSRRSITPRGEWHLWINCCNWRVFCADKEIAWNESSDEEIVKAANQVDGLLLINVAVIGLRRTSDFIFESDTRISMWPYDEEEAPQWLLFMPSGDVLTYRADGLYSLGPGNLPPDKQQWHTLP
jgi:hypothetical protein